MAAIALGLGLSLSLLSAPASAQKTAEELAQQYGREAVENALETKRHYDLYGIHFDFDKATIQSQTQPLLDDIAEMLEDFPNWRLQIVGHTDSTGDPAHNERLSRERAAAVKAALVDRGIEAARLEFGGAGESEPVASNDTPEGRELNRRVELVRLESVATGYSPVTDARLENPEPENWLLLRGNYQGWMYSPLDQINTHNVKNLTPVWSYSTGVDSGHEAPPIVNDGVMFVATPYDKVIALDAKSGDMLWEYERELPEGFGALHNTKRGIALYGDKVYMAAQDAVLVALDAATGAVAWESPPVADWQEGYYMTMAPLIVNGKVMVGVSGGEFGVRGFIEAYDAESGQSVWKTYTIPGPGEPGHDTWEGDTWQRGGASVWMTGTYDPETNVAFWGTGNGSPWFGDQRPGDNLYTSSTIAIDPDTGALKGHFQYHWNDSWDWDEMNSPMVIDYEKDGRTIKGLVKPSRNGYLYWLERSSDAINFVDATNYVKQDVFASVDAKSGRPTYNDEHKPGTGKYAEFCPSLWGGKDWPYEAYNPNTGMIYIPANDNHCGYLEGKVQEYVAGQWWTGVDIPDIGFTVDKDAKSYGEIQAWDVNTGEKAWTHTYPVMNWGSLLTTGGGLVFNGGTNDRMFRPFDARTGEQLWSFKTNSGIMAPPVSFEVDGTQYIAVQSGWGVDPAFQQGLINDLLGTDLVVPQGGVVWVFALGQ